MTDELRAQARRMMDADAATAGFGKSTPAPNVSIPSDAPGALEVTEAEHVLSITFTSRNDRPRPHVASLGYDGVVTCTCQATVPCWAVKAFCRITGRRVYP